MFPEPMASKQNKPSKSSRALHDLLNEDSGEASAVREAFHYTMLSKYRHAWGKPDADGVAKMHRLSNGLVPADGWETDADEDSAGDAA